MKRTIPSVLMILILVLTVAGSIAGCSPGEYDPGNPDSPQKARVLEIMRAINSKTVAVFIEDSQAALSLNNRLGIETAGNNGGPLNELRSYFGINPQDLAYSAYIYPFGPYFLLGDFDLYYTRARLAEMDYQRDDRKGIEVWWFDNSWYALHGNLFIYGYDGKNDKYSDWCISALNGEDKTLYEDPYFRNIIDDFPSAVLYNFSLVNQQDCEELKLYA
ncbi:MAG: hypothetical protein JSW38_04910, partial [Dehalococcoidia bacterium]